MAKVFPDGWKELTATGSAARELQTLGQLAAGLDDTYTVYHGVHWTRVERNNFAIVGEIDFAIVGPTGKLLLIEQKAGHLTETRDKMHRPGFQTIAYRVGDLPGPPELAAHPLRQARPLPASSANRQIRRAEQFNLLRG